MPPCGGCSSEIGTSRPGKTSGVGNRAVVTPTREEGVHSTEGVHIHRKARPAEAGNLWAPEVASCSKQWRSLETILEYPLGISELPPSELGPAKPSGEEQSDFAGTVRRMVVPECGVKQAPNESVQSLQSLQSSVTSDEITATKVQLDGGDADWAEPTRAAADKMGLGESSGQSSGRGHWTIREI